MKIFLGFVFIAFVTAQLVDLGDLLDSLRNRFGTGEGDTVDTVHGWRLEYHYGGTHHILLFINNNATDGRRYCYVIPLEPSWEPMMRNRTDIERITDEIYAMIHTPGHYQVHLRPTDLGQDLQHFDAAQECSGHETYDLHYTPSFD